MAPWEYQGRQAHGWFGHGTRPDAGDGGGDVDSGAADGIAGAIAASVAAMPAQERARYEALLAAGGGASLTLVLRRWAQAPSRIAAEFLAANPGAGLGPDVAERLWAAGVNAAGAGDAQSRRQAAVDLAGVVQAIGLDRFARAIAAAAEFTRVRHERNVEDLANLIYTEARGEPAVAQAAVGGTVLNRMRRNQTDLVSEVRRGYAFGIVAPPEAPARAIARRLLEGQIGDPANGATHFYSPSQMPKEGDKTKGRSIGGGLEQVPGVVRDQKPVKNYRPAFAHDEQFIQVPFPDIPEKMFKFYRRAGNAPVR